MSVPVWAWVAFAAFVVAMLALDLFVLHRRAQEVSPTEAARWTAVWLVIGLGFGGLLWACGGESTAQAYLAGYLIEKSLSLDNVFVFAVPPPAARAGDHPGRGRGQAADRRPL
ncbi:MAG TPA: hypothetical protein VJ347_19450 [Streptosporangiaceae bacterium]|nr:hypothetical protein [Streptosporangiaceae bacterium]